MASQPQQILRNLSSSIGLKYISRFTLATALGLALGACDKGEPEGDKSTESGSAGRDTGSSDKENNTDDSDTGNKEGKDPANADCSDIKWGSSLKLGGILPKSQAKGLLDSDGDHKAEDKEQEVGMCQLHQRKAKCGLIATGWHGCIGCPDEFRTIGDSMQELHDAGVDVYAIYSEVNTENGMKLMEKYLGTRPDMYSNSSELTLEFAPMKILVRLDTMEIIMLDRTEKGEPEVFHVNEAVDACKKL